jgi:transposase
MADHARFHNAQKVRDFVRAHRHQIRVFFLPKHAPELNPDEQVWNEIKHRQLGREPIIDLLDLNTRLRLSLYRLKNDAKQILSFFQLKDTKYVLNPIS